MNETLSNTVTPLTAPSFITTPIFYANGEPHLGHAYSGIIADIFHRFAQLSGRQSQLITGTDEHGQKIAATANNRQQPIQQFVDQTSQTFRSLWPALQVEPDIFIRTTESDHKARIQQLWHKLEAQGDIYPGHYRGNYCVACEQYYPDRELIDDQFCPVHKCPVSYIEEQTYLFRLEKYRQALLNFYQTHPDAILPSHFQQTLIEQLKSTPLDDLSVSRINNEWGIKVPTDDAHTVYVWIDALFSYISAIQRTGAESHAIAHTQHVIGKDILLFHAVYWPAFLLALDLPLPEKLIVHGWWTIDGDKISKSNPLTTVNPGCFAKRLTPDGLRYALVKQKPLHRDGNVVFDDFAEMINADLLNNLANLVKRNHTLIIKHFAGHIALKTVENIDLDCRQCITDSGQRLHTILNAYHRRDIHHAVREINSSLSELNNFFHQRAPWLAANQQTNHHTLQTCFIVSNVLRELAWLLYPVTPELCQKIITELSGASSTVLTGSKFILQDINIISAESHWQRIQS